MRLINIIRSGRIFAYISSHGDVIHAILIESTVGKYGWEVRLGVACLIIFREINNISRE